jgi:hypothetical protein
LPAVRLERHGLVAAWPLDPVVLVPERDTGRVGGNEPAVGDRDSMGVAGQIGQHLLGPGERPLAGFQFRKKPRPPSNSISFSNATSVPGSKQTAMFGSPTPAKPRVIELVNCVVTSFSPTLAGRVATSCKL